jgi:hypothetical protein
MKTTTKKEVALVCETVTPDGVKATARRADGIVIGTFPSMRRARAWLEDHDYRIQVDYPPGTDLHGLDLSGKTVLVREGFNDPLRLFYCAGGFGCSPSAMGRAVCGHWLTDLGPDGTVSGNGERIDRSDVLRAATEEELRTAAVYQSLPEAEKFMRELDAHAEQVERIMAEATAKQPKAGEVNMFDRLSVLAREYRRLSFWVNEQKKDFAEREIARRNALRQAQPAASEAESVKEGSG